MPETAGISYTVAGGRSAPSRPPLALVHGAGGSRLQWPAALRRLEGWTVYSLDLPGHGRSSGPGEKTIEGYVGRVLGWAEALRLGPAVLVGHSMGGAIAMLLALTAPERVAGLILIGSGGRLRVNPLILEGTTSPDGLREAVDLVVAWAFGRQAGSRVVSQSLREMMKTPAPVLHGDFQACDRFDVMDRLCRITAPTLVVCGREDRLTPEKYSRALAERIPRACLELVEGAGHMVMLERPAEMAKAVRSFVEGVLPTRA